MQMTVFVTDGEHRPAFAIVRALGRRGVTVIVAKIGQAAWRDRRARAPAR